MAAVIAIQVLLFIYRRFFPPVLDSASTSYSLYCPLFFLISGSFPRYTRYPNKSFLINRHLPPMVVSCQTRRCSSSRTTRHMSTSAISLLYSGSEGTIHGEMVYQYTNNTVLWALLERLHQSYDRRHGGARNGAVQLPLSRWWSGLHERRSQGLGLACQY